MASNRLIDLVGHRFGMLEVVERAPAAYGSTSARWLCRCDCGELTEAFGTELRVGKKASCGCNRGRYMRIEMAGQRFGRLVVLTRASTKEILDANRPSFRGAAWHCQCDCGGRVLVNGWRLRSGKAKSCGCHAGRPAGAAPGPTSCANDDQKTGFAEKPVVDLAGQRFGILTAVAPVGPSSQGWSWHVRCDCGRDHIARAKDLRSGNTASCGCLRFKRSRIGDATPTLNIARPWRPASASDVKAEAAV